MSTSATPRPEFRYAEFLDALGVRHLEFSSLPPRCIALKPRLRHDTLAGYWTCHLPLGNERVSIGIGHTPAEAYVAWVRVPSIVMSHPRYEPPAARALLR